jgi:hypothetical protein
VDWQKVEGEMQIQATIPIGSMAKFELPKGVASCSIDDERIMADEQGIIWIESGKYTIKYPEL